MTDDVEQRLAEEADRILRRSLRQKHSVPWHQRGGSRFGEDMGRRSDPLANFVGKKVRLAIVPLDSGGYDPGGAYWGVPTRVPDMGSRSGVTVRQVYCAWDQDGNVFYARGESRADIRALIPGARFYR